MQTMSYNDEQTVDYNDEPAELAAAVCAEQTTKYNDEIRGRTDKQPMMRNDTGSRMALTGRAALP